MKEIRHLLAELKNYPTNLFVYSANRAMSNIQAVGVEDAEISMMLGLVVCEPNGNEQGFIKIGDVTGEVKP